MILHRCGYGLKGIYSLEEYYARNLRGYYDALSIGPSHNYHMGRAEADVSGFVEFFCEGMADAFLNVRARAESVGGDVHGDKGAMMRELRPLQRQALGLFIQSKVVTAGELADYLGIAPRQGRDLCSKWIEEGFLVVENPSKKARSYRLAERYEEGLVAEQGALKLPMTQEAARRGGEGSSRSLTRTHRPAPFAPSKPRGSR